MLRRCFVFILLAVLFSSCRSTPPPTVTVILVPTFTPTSVAPAPPQRGVRSAYQSATGELDAFIAVNDEQSLWQPTLYTLHCLDLQGGAPTPFNQYQIPIEGKVLWAPDGSGAIVMTAYPFR